jgi:sulfatase-modifying factor enzyme 1
VGLAAASATFEPHAFRDVSAAGLLVTRSLSKATRAVWNNLSPNQALALKWYAFRCDAVVRRPQQGGYVVPMAPAGEGLLLSAAPVSFDQWERIRRIGVTNQYCSGLGDLGYALRSDGAMGEMETDGKPHAASEPVRRLTWVDAVAWCNMLSEYEGLEPAYYADPACTKVLRRVVNRSMREQWGSSPTVYWRKGAEGFRLPTLAELPSGNAFRWEGPSAGAALRLARSPAGSSGGEVVSREPDWPSTADAGADPDEIARAARAEARRLKFVRLPIGIAAPEDRDPFGVFIAQRAIGRARNDRFRGTVTPEQLEEITRRNQAPDYAARPTHDLEVGATEIPYRAWIALRHWAQREGYEFNYPGDMGSMRCLADADHEFSPDEPVTNICWHDALVWCNALSELTGRRCVYYNDSDLQQPYRRAITFRLDTFNKPGYPIHPAPLREAIGKRGTAPRPADTNCATRIYLDSEADGYRLPYVQEFDRLSPPRAHRGRGPLKGQTLATEGKPVRTGAVDAGKPNEQGLYELNGNVLEWAWSPLDTYLDVMGKYHLNGYGCFSMTPAQTMSNTKPYQDAVYNTRPYFGFRVVRRAE